MYYEEKMIDSLMHWRSNPDDDFRPYTLEELSRRYQLAQKEAWKYRAAILSAISVLKQTDA